MTYIRNKLYFFVPLNRSPAAKGQSTLLTVGRHSHREQAACVTDNHEESEMLSLSDFEGAIGT